MSQMRMKLREGLSEGMEEFLPRATLELESEGKTKTGVDDLLRKRESQGQRAADEPSTALNKNGAAGTPKLTRIAELILGVDARAIAFEDKEGAEEETRNQARKQLAASLGCTLPDLDSVVDSYGIAWQEMVLEERIRLGIDSAPIRDASWDRLESAVLRKLIHLVDKNLVKEVGELVAIAKTANGAIRGERKGSGSRPQGDGTGIPGVGIQVNNYLPGNPEAGVLPSGNLGRITLSLTPRLVKQIESTVVEKTVRQIDSVDMMSLEEIQNAVDGKQESEE